MNGDEIYQRETEALKDANIPDVTSCQFTPMISLQIDIR